MTSTSSTRRDAVTRSQIWTISTPHPLDDVLVTLSIRARKP